MTNTLSAPPEHNPPALETDAALSLREVADLLSRDISTVKAWNRDGRWPGAAQDVSGRRSWRVPVFDLVAAGDVQVSQVALVESELASRRESRQVQQLRELVIRLEERLAAAEERACERAATVELLTRLLSRTEQRP